MLMTKERPRAIRMLRGWAIGVLQEAGAIRECEEHGCAGPGRSARARGRLRYRQAGPAPGISPDDAVAEVRNVLESIGDTCPECPPYSE